MRRLEFDREIDPTEQKEEKIRLLRKVDRIPYFPLRKKLFEAVDVFAKIAKWDWPMALAGYGQDNRLSRILIEDIFSGQKITDTNIKTVFKHIKEEDSQPIRGNDSPLYNTEQALLGVAIGHTFINSNNGSKAKILDLSILAKTIARLHPDNPLLGHLKDDDEFEGDFAALEPKENQAYIEEINMLDTPDRTLKERLLEAEPLIPSDGVFTVGEVADFIDTVSTGSRDAERETSAWITNTLYQNRNLQVGVRVYFNTKPGYRLLFNKEHALIMMILIGKKGLKNPKNNMLENFQKYAGDNMGKTHPWYQSIYPEDPAETNEPFTDSASLQLDLDRVKPITLKDLQQIRNILSDLPLADQLAYVSIQKLKALGVGLSEDTLTSMLEICIKISEKLKKTSNINFLWTDKIDIANMSNWDLLEFLNFVLKECQKYNASQEGILNALYKGTVKNHYPEPIKNSTTSPSLII